jgi:hypothetical protein
VLQGIGTRVTETADAVPLVEAPPAQPVTALVPVPAEA